MRLSKKSFVSANQIGAETDIMVSWSDLANSNIALFIRLVGFGNVSIDLTKKEAEQLVASIQSLTKAMGKR